MQSSSNAISYFLFLIGALIAGSAFTIATDDPNLYGIGRTLSFFSSGFLPIVLYCIYREYTAGRTHPLAIAVLSIIPIVTTVLAMTNPMHNMIWTSIETDTGIRFSNAADHLWFKRVHAPFAYGLFGYSVLAMASRLPNIARAHRRKIILLLVCAVLPYSVSVANNFLGIGPIEFPFTASTLALMLPLYWWASLDLRDAHMDGLLESNMKKARELLKEAGYDGTLIVLLHSTDLAVLTNLAPVAKSLMEKAGFKVDMQSMDWQTLVARRSKKDPPDKGGWNAFITSWTAGDLFNPVAMAFLNASCDKALFGWPCDKQIEDLRDQFARATDESKQLEIVKAIQKRWTEYPTHVHLGQWYSLMALRNNVDGALQTAGVPVLWNMEKK
jgi:hypothetical protein